jgi:hypothetical protein
MKRAKYNFLRYYFLFKRTMIDVIDNMMWSKPGDEPFYFNDVHQYHCQKIMDGIVFDTPEIKELMDDIVSADLLTILFDYITKYYNKNIKNKIS